MDLSEYMQHDATALAELVASKQVTAAELLELARKRAAEVNPTLNAIIVDIDKESDKQAAAHASGQLSGPFAGVPFLVKDLAQEYKGYPTSYGSRALKNWVADEHSLVTQRFLEAGLMIFGKTATPELGAKGITESELWGPTRNPWDTTRTPGGSSGGSAAAVAAGIVPAAGANDGGGSIRIPAACNGLVGLKPSRGIAPYGPQTNEAMFGMAVQGVVAQTVRDSAALMDAIIGPNPLADYQVKLPDRPFLEEIQSQPQKLKIGYSAQSAITDSPDPEAVKAMENTAQLLSELGHDVEEVPPPYDDKALAADFLAVWFAICATEVQMAMDLFGAKPKDFEADTLAMAEIGRANGAAKSGMALLNTVQYTHAISRYYDHHDIFMTPTISRKPLKIGELDTPPALQKAARAVYRGRAGKMMLKTNIIDDMIEKNLGWVPYTQLANLTGRPAISVPIHWTDDGLPLGVQFNGALGTDGALLALAAQLEEARPWRDRFPAQPTGK